MLTVSTNYHTNQDDYQFLCLRIVEYLAERLVWLRICWQVGLVFTVDFTGQGFPNDSQMGQCRLKESHSNQIYYHPCSYFKPQHSRFLLHWHGSSCNLETTRLQGGRARSFKDHIKPVR
eukprot:946951-Amphidinium_carterae.1